MHPFLYVPPFVTVPVAFFVLMVIISISWIISMIIFLFLVRIRQHLGQRVYGFTFLCKIRSRALQTAKKRSPFC